MPKGFHRIKAHRPARGNPPCKRRDAQQQRGDDSEHGWFSRTHAKEKRMHGACFKNGAPQRRRRAHRGEQEALSQNQGEDTSRRRSTCHANAYFLSALADVMRQNRKQSKTSEKPSALASSNSKLNLYPKCWE